MPKHMTNHHVLWAHRQGEEQMGRFRYPRAREQNRVRKGVSGERLLHCRVVRLGTAAPQMRRASELH